VASLTQNFHPNFTEAVLEHMLVAFSVAASFFFSRVPNVHPGRYFVAQVKFEVKGGDRDGMVYEGEMRSGEVSGKGVAYHDNGAKRCAPSSCGCFKCLLLSLFV
jgi:hypothetical protein